LTFEGIAALLDSVRRVRVFEAQQGFLRRVVDFTLVIGRQLTARNIDRIKERVARHVLPHHADAPVAEVKLQFLAITVLAQSDIPHHRHIHRFTTLPAMMAFTCSIKHMLLPYYTWSNVLILDSSFPNDSRPKSSIFRNFLISDSRKFVE